MVPQGFIYCNLSLLWHLQAPSFSTVLITVQIQEPTIDSMVCLHQGRYLCVNEDCERATKISVKDDYVNVDLSLADEDVFARTWKWDAQGLHSSTDLNTTWKTIWATIVFKMITFNLKLETIFKFNLEVSWIEICCILLTTWFSFRGRHDA